jgi:MYXO-CTERM domain-containing protein
MRDAAACGCLTPPDPTVPIVQAGEKILFGIQNGIVTAHIQIQYSGKQATDFGWLLPLPSVPTLELGTDELFAQLYATTQPKYRQLLAYVGNCGFAQNRGGNFGAPSSSGAGGGDSSGENNTVVIQDSIGPYDYAVLHADSKDDMLKWLSDNHYFVPAGTDDVVGPYIHQGAYFLALKLHSGETTGDLQPVVVHYASDLPMIPLVLTSVGAQPNMGIQVWMLGQGRAIPRNYLHTVIDDTLIDWPNAGANYNDVITKAVGEAEGKKSFVTEYAGTSQVMKNVLNAPGRFGSIADLAAQTTPSAFFQYLFAHGYAVLTQSRGGPIGGGGFQLTSQAKAVLAHYVPEPSALATKGISADQFYQSYDYYTGTYRQQNPGDFTGWTMNFLPDMMAQDLKTKVVDPTLAAGAMFDQSPYLTRLYTTISPEDMTKDPVFSYNPGLPDVSNVHQATLTYYCGWFGNSQQATTPAQLKTEQGFLVDFPHGTGTAGTYVPSPDLPGSLRTEILREEGAPEVVSDNSHRISNVLSGDSDSGCSTAVGRTERTAGVAFVMLAAVVFLGLVRRRKGSR